MAAGEYLKELNPAEVKLLDLLAKIESRLVAVERYRNALQEVVQAAQDGDTKGWMIASDALQTPEKRKDGAKCWCPETGWHERTFKPGCPLHDPAAAEKRVDYGILEIPLEE